MKNELPWLGQNRPGRIGGLILHFAFLLAPFFILRAAPLDLAPVQAQLTNGQPAQAFATLSAALTNAPRPARRAGTPVRRPAPRSPRKG